jgi:hypothetical protein
MVLFFCVPITLLRTSAGDFFFFSLMRLTRSRSASRGFSTRYPQLIHQRGEFSTALSPKLARKWWIKGLPPSPFFRYTCSIKRLLALGCHLFHPHLVIVRVHFSERRSKDGVSVWNPCALWAGQSVYPPGVAICTDEAASAHRRRASILLDAR